MASSDDRTTLLIWHGYLLGGTGSNIYTTNIAASWVAAGHDVIVMCQEAPQPGQYPWAHEFHRVLGAEIVERVELVPGGCSARHAAGEASCLVVQTDIDGLLPVYVLDRYEGFEVKRFADCTDAELARWAEAYCSALRGLAERHHIVGALLNHAVMGPPMLRDTLDDLDIPYSVKVHGSELEYCIADDPARFAAPALAGLTGARSIIVGSQHIADRTIELVAGGDDAVGAALSARMFEVPPGVDLVRFHRAEDRAAVAHDLVDSLRVEYTRGRGAAADAAMTEAIMPAAGACARLAALHGTYDERAVDIGADETIAAMDLAADEPPTVCYVGKFIRQKGVHCFLAALPFVRQRVPDVHVVLAGFGPMREGLQALVRAMSTGDVALLRELADHGELLDGGDDAPLAELAELIALLESTGELAAWLAAAADIESAVEWTGLVDHSVLQSLWPLCRASVVPSILPEAFGMVSAEAAACGCLPIVSNHSGLATVARELRMRVPAPHDEIVAFDEVGAAGIRALADRLVRACTIPVEARDGVAAALRQTVVEEWSWGALAARVAESLDVDVDVAVRQ